MAPRNRKLVDPPARRMVGSSVYLGESIVSDVETRAERDYRTWSAEICWLVALGLRRRSMLAADPESTRDDARGRRYFYAPAALHDAVAGARTAVHSETAKMWSTSAMVRGLILVGMRIDDLLAAQLAAIGAHPCDCPPDQSRSSPSLTRTVTEGS